MKPQWCIRQLAHNGKAIVALAAGIGEEQARWRPAPGEWSMLQVYQHLVSEERNDFRKWLAPAVGVAVQPLPLEDAPRGAGALRLHVAHFSQERRHSLIWLRRLRGVDWDARASVGRGRRATGDLLSAWVAHDLLHLRQLIALKYGLTQAACAPHRLGYAGKW